MNYEGTITIDLPDFLFGSLQAITHGHLKTQGELVRRIILILSDLTDAAIRPLPDPPREGPFWELRLDLEWEYLHILLEASRGSHLDISTLFCRIFGGLITGKFNSPFFTQEDRYEMTRIEMEKDFYEFSRKSRAEEINSAASRQHPEKP